ncbi:hypothetical protein C2S51_002749 [Perilla frutescens var. frutescens]|nr:hypothetical protein C2S51_002749 [Perilla frutescens var. frutescens]
MDGGKRKLGVSGRTRSYWEEYFKKCHDELKKKDQENGGNGVSKSVLAGILKVAEVDVDNSVGILSGEDDVRLLKSDDEEDDSGVELLKFDGDGNNGDVLRSDGSVLLKSDDDDDDEDSGGVEILRSDDKNGAEILKCDEADDCVEIVKSDESELKVGDLDEVVSSLAEGFENATIESDSSGSSGGKALIEPLGVEQILRDISVDSDSSIGSRNSAEDSDGSDESVDSQVSESEPTSEEDDELFDEDYKYDESSNSEASDDIHHEDDECSVGEDEDVMILPDAVEDVSTLAVHEKSTGKNPRKGVDTEQERDDVSDEGCNEDDHCKRSADYKSDGEVFVADVEENFPRVRKSKRKNLERDDEIDERERNSARKNQKGDSEEEIHLVHVECVEPNSVSKSQKRKLEHGKCSYPSSFESAFSTDNNEFISVKDEVECFFTQENISGQQYSEEKVKLDSIKSRSARDLDLIKILVDSINSAKENQYNIDENALVDDALPLRFGFEDEVVPPPEKSEWEKHMDSLFCDLELGLRESETDCTDNVATTMESDDLETTVEIEENIAVSCSRGKHHAILDEQIGIICKYCDALIMDIKHVLPPFHTSTRERRDRQYFYDEPPSSFFSEMEFQGSASGACGPTSCTKGTVWDLIPGVKKELYPHQREGFEFIWRNIAGGTIIEELKQNVADEARGCIISHAPGTGKTRLTIVFLQTFLKLYPACSPMIIAPKGMLLTWEAEFKKWNFNVSFHNLNKKELSGNENALATQLLGQASCGALSQSCIRLLKLYSWSRGGTVLGISYMMFERLAGENGRGEGHEKIREVLRDRTGLLVLDEGHTPRNDRSLIWKALRKVTTQRRIILSGTPFQNSLKELYNTLCVVNPKYANQNVLGARKRWRYSSNRGDALRLRAMLDPFVHVHKGTILEESLPGLRHTLVFLHPTECQKTLLKSASKERRIFRRIRMVSLISVHPSINAVMERYPAHLSKLEEIKADVDAGVKARFLMKLIRFSDALGERVLVFSQFIDSLAFIKEQLESNFSWNEGREVLYMDGQLEDTKRQSSIYAFNDGASEAKVMLASERACSEGINLIGASRVVLLDTVWNPSVEKQAISRAYRLGQKKVVHVYRLFTSGIEERQYAHQIHKERMSEWIFSLGDGHGCRSERQRAVSEDKVLDAMLDLDNFNHIFEKIISQPKESDLIKTFGLEK